MSGRVEWRSMPAARSSLILLALVMTGCRAAPERVSEQAAEVQVEPLEARFEGGATAEFVVPLRLNLEDPRPLSLVSVSWEIRLSGRSFAAGTQQLHEELAPREARTLTLKLPVVFRRLPIVPTLRSIELGVRGTLIAHAGADERAVAFRSIQKILAANAPTFEGASEEE